VRRRAVIAGITAATTAWALAARAQQAAMPVVGFLHSASADLYGDRVQAFRQGLSDAGFVEGRNVAIDYRWGEGNNDRLPALAADLVRAGVNVIATGGIPGVLAARGATTTIPIVFQFGADPVELGLVASLNRPGGNLTGVTNLNVELGPKRLELLHQAVPTARVITLLVDPTNPGFELQAKVIRAAASTLGLRIDVVQASAPADLDAAFSKIIPQLEAQALVISTGGFFLSRAKELGALSLRHAVPAIFQYREFTAAGGLMSYAGSFSEAYRLVGVYVGRILKGEKAAELPVQQATTVELIINLRTAKALGLNLSLPLLGHASEVIE
jgi:putative tryptophan/tyrosine transport system substrate-binding protein